MVSRVGRKGATMFSGMGERAVFFFNSSFFRLTSLFSMILLANTLNTLIQLDNSKHRSRAISRLSEGRKIHILLCNIDYPAPLSQCSRSPRHT